MPKRKSITGDNSLVPIRKQEVPVYLRSGAFYQSLSDDDDDNVILVPRNSMKADLNVFSASDAIHLFESLRFWMVDKIPAPFVEFALTRRKAFMFPPAFWDEFGDHFKWLQTIRKCIKGSIKLTTTQMQHIISAGNKELFQTAYYIIWCMPENACELAIASGSVECLHFAFQHSWRPVFGQDPCNAAIMSGKDEKLLAAVHELGGEWGADTCRFAAYRGNLRCLQYLHEHGCPWDESVCTLAAQRKHMQCLQYALENGCPCDGQLCNDAARLGDLESLKWLHQHGYPWAEDTCMWATNSCSLPCLQYAHEHGAPWDEEVCAEAAGIRNLQYLTYLHEHGCPWDECTCETAAGNGYLASLQYAHLHGCPWDAGTCYSAAARGHLPCLQYAHERGCPIDRRTVLNVLFQGGGASDQCQRYIAQHCSPGDLAAVQARRKCEEVFYSW